MSNKKRFIDFDAYWAETVKTDDAPQIKVFGEIYTLPPSPPALTVVRVMRQSADAEAALTGEDVIAAADSIFGRETLDKWLYQGLTVKQLFDLVNQTLDMYISGFNDSEEEGEDAEGNAGAA